MTPIECWIGNEPHLPRLQIFGSMAYAKKLGYLNKLESRSKIYIFVGNAPNGNRLWHESDKQIVIHRDIIFKKLETDNHKYQHGEIDLLST